MREKADADGGRRAMIGTGATATRRAPEGVRGAIRIKARHRRRTVVHDLVQGEVRFPTRT